MFSKKAVVGIGIGLLSFGGVCLVLRLTGHLSNNTATFLVLFLTCAFGGVIAWEILYRHTPLDMTDSEWDILQALYKHGFFHDIIVYNDKNQYWNDVLAQEPREFRGKAIVLHTYELCVRREPLLGENTLVVSPHFRQNVFELERKGYLERKDSSSNDHTISYSLSVPGKRYCDKNAKSLRSRIENGMWRHVVHDVAGRFDAELVSRLQVESDMLVPDFLSSDDCIIDGYEFPQDKGDNPCGMICMLRVRKTTENTSSLEELVPGQRVTLLLGSGRRRPKHAHGWSESTLEVRLACRIDEVDSDQEISHLWFESLRDVSLRSVQVVKKIKSTYYPEGKLDMPKSHIEIFDAELEKELGKFREYDKHRHQWTRYRIGQKTRAWWRTVVN